MQTASILPELVSGRGTTRRVVEGQPFPRLMRKPAKHRISIVQDICGRNPKRFDSRRTQPLVPSRISLWLVSQRMRFSVHLNRQPRIAAEKSNT